MSRQQSDLRRWMILTYTSFLKKYFQVGEPFVALQSFSKCLYVICIFVLWLCSAKWVVVGSSFLFIQQYCVICSTSENAKHFLELVLLSLTTSEMKTRASFKITGVHCMSALLCRGDLLHPRLPCGKAERTIKKSAGRHFLFFFFF